MFRAIDWFLFAWYASLFVKVIIFFLSNLKHKIRHCKEICDVLKLFPAKWNIKSIWTQKTSDRVFKGQSIGVQLNPIRLDLSQLKLIYWNPPISTDLVNYVFDI